MGPPETTIWEYPFPERSWKDGIDYCINAVEKGWEPAGNLEDAKQALIIIDTVYRKNGQ